MLMLCPKCYTLSRTHQKRCTDCKALYIKVHEDLEIVVIKLLAMGFKVAHADCNTYDTDDGAPQIKAFIINIIFWFDYPDSLFEGLPQGWVKTHGVTVCDVSGGSELSYTEQYPMEYDRFQQWCAKQAIVAGLEAWVDNNLSADGVNAVLKLGGYL